MRIDILEILMRDVPADFDSLRIESVSTSTRLTNSLKGAGLSKIGDLRQISEDQIGAVWGCGKGTLSELRALIAKLGAHSSKSEKSDLAPSDATKLAIEAWGSLSIADLPFSASLKASLDHIRVTKICDLRRRRLDMLRRAGALSSTDLDELVHFLHGLISFGVPTVRSSPASTGIKGTKLVPPELPPELPPGAPLSLQGWLALYGSQIESKRLDIAYARLGFWGAPPTLEDLGRERGVTRERIRQIEASVLHKFRTGLGIDLGGRLIRLLNGCRSTLFLDVLPVEDPWFDVLDRPTSFLEGLVTKVAIGEFHVLDHRDRSFVARVPDSVIKKIALVVTHAAEDLVREGIDREAVGLIAHAVSREMGAPEATKIVLERCESMLHFAPDGTERLLGVGKSMERKVEAALRHAGQPLHYSEVRKLVREITHEEAAERRVHSALAASQAVLVSRGVYALPDALDIDPELQDEIIAFVTEKLRHGPRGKQWHCHELMDSFSEHHEDLPEFTNGHLLNAFLRGAPDLEYLGRQVWIYKGAGPHEEVGRVDIQQACEAIVAENGGPMSQRELRLALKRHRGISSNFQLHPRGDLVQLGPRTWGLRDRDLGISRAEQCALLEKLWRLLIDRQKALHLTEASKSLTGKPWSRNSLDEYKLFGLARLDTRFRVFRGQFLGLSEWGEPRRLTVAHAVRSIGAEVARSSTDEQIIRLVSRLVERDVSPQEVLNALSMFTDEDSDGE